MNLKEYLINCFLEEREIIEELIYIDNSIQKTNFIYEQMLNDIREVKADNQQVINEQCIAITDGELKTVFKILISIPTLNTIWVNRTSLGINKYLVSRINLDITKDYFKYKNSQYPIIISGFDFFVEGISEDFNDAIILE